MRKNDISFLKDEIYRILQIKDDNCLVINCNGNSMPIWMPLDTFWDVPTISDEDLYTQLNKEFLEDDLIVPERKRIMYERFTMIAPILSFIDDSYTRSHVITRTIEGWISANS